MTRAGRRLASALPKLLVLTLATIAALVLAEAGIRLFDLVAGTGARPDTVWEFSWSRHHRLVPDGTMLHSSAEFRYRWTNNSLGMRDRERSLEKAPGTFRILVLGDSFVQGHSVALKDTVTILLEQDLNGGGAHAPIEVLNAGVFGYSPLLESLYLAEIADSVRPDLVIVGFFLGNDVGEDFFYEHVARHDAAGGVYFDDHQWPWTRIVNDLDREEGRPPATPTGDAAPRPAGFLGFLKASILLRSRIYRLLREQVRAVTDRIGYRERRQREFALVRRHRDDIRYEMGLVNYPVLTAEKRSRYWDLTRANLRAIRDLCRARAIPMVLVVIPPFERLIGETELDEPYAVTDDIGRELSVPVIQLLDVFRGQDPYRIYFEYDRHWTPAGHRLVADVLTRDLRRLDLVP